MSTDEHSLRKFMPDFVISAGTRVVLKVMVDSSIMEAVAAW